MDIQSVWVIILAIATPLAGVVGFGIQLRNVKKLRLENEKLELEVQMMRKAIESADSQIVRPTNDEVMKFINQPMFSRIPPLSESDYESSDRKPSFPIRELVSTVGWFLLIFLFLAYFIYDLYRFGSWVWSLCNNTFV